MNETLQLLISTGFGTEMRQNDYQPNSAHEKAQVGLMWQLLHQTNPSDKIAPTDSHALCTPAF